MLVVHSPEVFPPPQLWVGTVSEAGSGGQGGPRLCTTVDSPVENYMDVVLHNLVPNVQNRRPSPGWDGPAVARP